MRHFCQHRQRKTAIFPSQGLAQPGPEVPPPRPSTAVAAHLIVGSSGPPEMSTSPHFSDFGYDRDDKGAKLAQDEIRGIMQRVRNHGLLFHIRVKGL
jgi:hypothetical protein